MRHRRTSPALRALRSLLLGMAALWIALVLALWLHGMPRQLVSKIETALGGSQYTVAIFSVRLHPLRGLMAEGIHVFDAMKNEVAAVDALRVLLDWNALLQGRIGIQELELTDASVSLHSSGGQTITFSEAHASILMLPSVLRVTKLEANVEGLHLKLSATLRNPQKLDPRRIRVQTATASDRSNLHEWLAYWREISWDKAAPVLSLEASGDLADPASLRMERIMFTASSMNWRGAGLDELKIEASYSNRRFLVENLQATLPQNGFLRAEGWIEQDTSRAALFAKGKAILEPWLRAFFGPSFEKWEMELTGPSEFEFTLQTQGPGIGKPTPLLTGSLRLDKPKWRGVALDFASAEWAWQPGRLLLRKGTCHGLPLNVGFDALHAEDHLRIKLAGFINPTLCLPWLDQGLRRIFSQIEMPQPGEGAIELTIPLQNSALLSGTGWLRFGRSSKYAVWLDEAHAALEVGGRAVRYTNLHLKMGDRTATANVTYDMANRQVRIEELRSDLPPVDFLMWIDPKIAHSARPYRFHSTPLVTGNGVVDLAGGNSTSLDFTVSARGMDYDLLGKTLNFKNLGGTLSVRHQQIIANISRSEIFGGTATVRADVSLSPPKPEYQLAIKASGVDFASLSRLYFSYNGSHGLMSGEFFCRAEIDRPLELIGQGWVRIENGDVFDIPLFGPLSGIVDTIAPGAGYTNARLATASFEVSNGAIRTRNLEIAGKGFSMFGEGAADFVKDELEMTVRINAQGTPGMVLLPLSKILEYTSSGPISNPKWRPRHVPQEFYGGGIIESVTGPLRSALETAAEQLTPTERQQQRNSHQKPR